MEIKRIYSFTWIYTALPLTWSDWACLSNSRTPAAAVSASGQLPGPVDHLHSLSQYTSGRHTTYCYLLKRRCFIICCFCFMLFPTPYTPASRLIFLLPVNFCTSRSCLLLPPESPASIALSQTCLLQLSPENHGSLANTHNDKKTNTKHIKQPYKWGQHLHILAGPRHGGHVGVEGVHTFLDTPEGFQEVMVYLEIPPDHEKSSWRQTERP